MKLLLSVEAYDETPQNTQEPIAQTIEEKQETTENQDTRKPMVTISGPLSEMYTQALNVVYAKKEGDGERFVMNELGNDNARVKQASESMAISSVLDSAVINHLEQERETENNNSYELTDMSVRVTNQEELNSEEGLNKIVGDVISNGHDQDNNVIVVDEKNLENSNHPAIEQLNKLKPLMGFKLLYGFEQLRKHIKK
jgi:hypothetical protein